jgi:hypothetical protein
LVKTNQIPDNAHTERTASQCWLLLILKRKEKTYLFTFTQEFYIFVNKKPPLCIMKHKAVFCNFPKQKPICCVLHFYILEKTKEKNLFLEGYRTIKFDDHLYDCRQAARLFIFQQNCFTTKQINDDIQQTSTKGN